MLGKLAIKNWPRGEANRHTRPERQYRQFGIRGYRRHAKYPAAARFVIRLLRRMSSLIGFMGMPWRNRAMINRRFILRMSEAMNRFVGGRKGNCDRGGDQRKRGYAGEPYRQPKKYAFGQCCEHIPWRDSSR